MTKNWPYFLLFSFLTILCLAMSVFYLPFILLKPTKFTGCLTLGSIFCMSAVISIKGFKAFVQGICSKNALIVNLVYNIMWGGTVYFSLINPNYFGALLFGLGYMFSIVFIMVSFIPGGAKGMIWIAKKSTTLAYRTIGKFGVWGVGKGASLLPF